MDNEKQQLRAMVQASEQVLTMMQIDLDKETKENKKLKKLVKVLITVICILAGFIIGSAWM